MSNIEHSCKTPGLHFCIFLIICACLPPPFVGVRSEITHCAEVCACVFGRDWQKGWQWGLHSKKGFLPRWRRRDWQDAILYGSSVSQAVSLSVRQYSLNLAFCWAVTGLPPTLHVASLINCTMSRTHKARTRLDELCVPWHCDWKSLWWH